MGWRPRPPPPDQASRPWQLVWSRAQWGEDTGHQETVLSVRGHVTSVTTRRQGCSLCDAAEDKTLKTETHVTCLSKEIIVMLMPYKLHIRMTRCQCAKRTAVELLCWFNLSWNVELCALWSCLVMKPTWYRCICAVLHSTYPQSIATDCCL